MATIHIDDVSYEANPAHNLLQAALSAGCDLPYFCWHPALGSVGACRQCAVRQFRDADDQHGQIVMACMSPVTDGARISIDDPEAKQFRAAVIEWLMTNHPHDCPVCDEGGECHLQDMTVMCGHSRRRFRFNKRTFHNQYLGPFINHEMNRCIECYRCVRYYRDYAGGRDLNVFAAHHHVNFGRACDGTLESEFSGNLVEICPTGVFTDKTLKMHFTRKWDMQSGPSLCEHCSVGCNTIASARYGSIRRILNRFHGDINGYFLCDRGRFGYEYTNASNRPRQPRTVNEEGKPVNVEPLAAMHRIRDVLASAKGICGIGSPRASLESNFAVQVLADPDCYSPGLSSADHTALTTLIAAMRNAPGGVASLHDVEHSDAAFVLGEDPSNTAPRMALSLRQSVRQTVFRQAEELRIPVWLDRGVRDLAQDSHGPLFIAWPTATRLDDVATATYRASPVEIARFGFAVANALDPSAPAVPDLSTDAKGIAGQIAERLRMAERPVIVTGTSLKTPTIISAALTIVRALHRAGKSNARLATIADEANSVGVGLLGGISLEAVEEQLRSGRADTVVVVENDITRRLPRERVDNIFKLATTVIAIDSIASSTSERADVLLPATAVADGIGTFVNHEGRAQRHFPALPASGFMQESWRWIGQILALRDGLPKARWEHFDAIIDDLIGRYPELTNVREAAPRASMRANGQKFPRSPRRFSGRTSILANTSVHEPKPAQDGDAPLSFTMEGSPLTPPAALVTHYWAPGWNSVQALNKFQHEVGGTNAGGPPGKRIIAPSGSEIENALVPSDVEVTVPEAQPAGNSVLVAIPLPHIFGSGELSSRCPAIRERCPDVRVVMAPADAERLGLVAAQEVRFRINSRENSAPLHIDTALANGLVGIPGALTDLPAPFEIIG